MDRTTEQEPSIRVLIADDQHLIRVGLRGILESEPGITVVGAVTNGAEAVQAVRSGGVDVVLMDLRMPVLDGTEATRQLTEDPGASAEVAILVLTTFEGDQDVLAAVAAGARGYLGKDSDPESLLDAIRILARGQTLLSPRAMTALSGRAAQLGHPRPLPTPPPELTGLTERELEIAILAARGLSNDDIAQQLFISPATVKTHVNRSMSKIHVSDRAALVVAVYSAGLVDGQPRTAPRGD